MRVRYRSDAPDLTVWAESATQLAPDDWQDGTLLLVEQSTIHHDPGLEERLYRLALPADSLGFFRLRALLSD